MSDAFIVRRGGGSVASAGFSYTYTPADGVRETEVNGVKRLEFISSGTLVMDKNIKIDAFLVGGGGSGRYGGGGGGYTTTVKGISLSAGTEYQIVIGAGGEGSTDSDRYGTDGGKTEAFDAEASGGIAAGKASSGAFKFRGSDGGSGGGGSSTSDYGTIGGDGGSNGSDGTKGGYSGGVGQGGTTRAFGEDDGKLYGGGGGGCPKSTSYSGGAGGEGGGAAGTMKNGDSAQPNTGGGGGGTFYAANGTNRNGGSGIVIIRRAR